MAWNFLSVDPRQIAFSRETEKAYCLWLGPDREVWVPKAACRFVWADSYLPLTRRDLVSAQIADWAIREKGLEELLRKFEAA